MWPKEYAEVELTPEVEGRITAWCGSGELSAWRHRPRGAMGVRPS